MDEKSHIEELLNYRMSELEQVNEELKKEFGTYNPIIMTALGHYHEKLEEEIKLYNELFCEQ